MKFLPLLLLIQLPNLALAKEALSKLHIAKLSSGVNYPAKGDESIDMTYEGNVYKLRILHPKLTKPSGPHFSTPHFWVTSKADHIITTENFISIKTLLDGLKWHSAQHAYFFDHKKKKFSGFFLEDGFDNEDWGSAGLLFTFDGKKVAAWQWDYERDPTKQKGAYSIHSADDSKNPAPQYLYSDLKELLDLVEKEAQAWPGP